MNFQIIPLSVLLLLGNIYAASGQLNYETRLYNCIDQDFKNRGFDLKTSLDAFENQLSAIGYLSDTVSIFDLLKEQISTGALPMTIENYVEALDVRTNSYEKVRTNCYATLDADRETSKYHKMILNMQRIEERTPLTIWKSIAEVVTKEDYEHPMYRLMALSILHSFSLDHFGGWYPDFDSTMDTVMTDFSRTLSLQFTDKGIFLEGTLVTEKYLSSYLETFLYENPKKTLHTDKSSKRSI